MLAGVQSIFRGTPQYRERVEPRDIRKHPGYNSDTLLNDIGLVYVVRRFVFNNVIQSIALPPRSQMLNRFIGTEGTVIGWGRFSDGKFTNKSATCGDKKFDKGK